MNKSKMSENFKRFLESQGMNPNNYEYIGQDHESYTIKNLINGNVGDIRR
jgi:aspartate/tyrosine/aromatic aminotransferase